MLKLQNSYTQNYPYHHSKVTFQGRYTPSKKTINYLKSLSSDERNVKAINTEKIEDVLKGIPIFEGIKVKDLFENINNFESILLQRGCIHKCTHCAAEASNRIKIMQWDNYKKIVDGISTLNKRLGFNPFSKKEYVSFFKQIDVATLYHDSDPMIYRSKGADGTYHDIFDAAKYLHEKTGSKTYIQTAGWLSNASSQTALKFVKDSSMLNSFSISVHPFHKYMERSISADIKGNKAEAKHWHNLYVEMIANNLRTIKNMKADINNGILLEFVDPSGKLNDANRKQYYSKEAVQKLYNEILKKLNNENIGIKSSNVSYRTIALQGRGSSLGVESPKFDGYERPTKSTDIDVDGTFLSNPFKPGIVFFKPTPIFDSNGTPIKLNFNKESSNERLLDKINKVLHKDFQL